MGEILAILSGKGGTGKTSLCAGIATALAQQDKKVLCIDCDVGLRNLDIALGLGEEAALSFLDLCQGAYSFSQATQHPLYPGLFFLTAPVNCRADQVDLAAFGAMLRRAREAFSYVLLDAPAGLDAGFRLCASFADRCILVTNPEPAAIRDAARTGQQLELLGRGSVRLIVNRADKEIFHVVKTTVDDIMDQTGIPLLGIVPEDFRVTLAAAMQKPLLTYTKKGASAACKRIAKRIQGIPVPISIRKL